ncbi:MAG: RNA polymerase sigma factor [Solirubrobacteraceae bacterium]
MSSVDNLPGDQRAVLQLVLGRSRSYDEIARLLSINPTSVGERAHAALDALGPQTRVSEENRALIGDYLLGQLPADQVDGVRELLARSPSERAWARVLSAELAPVAAGPLPEIPTDTPAARAAAPAAAVPAAEPAPTEPVTQQPAEKPGARRRRRQKAPKEKSLATKDDGAKGDGATGDGAKGDGAKPSSRLGGIVLIVVIVALIVLVLIKLLGGSSSPKHPATSTTHTAASAGSTPSTTTPSTTTASTTTTSSSSASASTSTSARILAQITLAPPTTVAAGSAAAKATGIAEVLSEATFDGIAIVASDVPPNTTSPPNAYAVWLYNSPTDAHILGFVNPGVGANGRLSTIGRLPSNAAHYKQLLVTVETSGTPRSPGPILLEGTLAGL